MVPEINPPFLTQTVSNADTEALLRNFYCHGSLASLLDSSGTNGPPASVVPPLLQPFKTTGRHTAADRPSRCACGGLPEALQLLHARPVTSPPATPPSHIPLPAGTGGQRGLRLHLKAELWPHLLTRFYQSPTRLLLSSTPVAAFRISLSLIDAQRE